MSDEPPVPDEEKLEELAKEKKRIKQGTVLRLRSFLRPKERFQAVDFLLCPAFWLGHRNPSVSITGW